MGCHTWFYKKAEITIEQAKEDFIKICDYKIDYYKEYIENPSLLKQLFESEKELEEEYNLIIRSNDFFKRCKIFHEKGLFKKNQTYFLFYQYDNHLLKEKFDTSLSYFCKRTDSLYISTHGLPYNIFRIGNYPENELLSYEETIDFIESNREKVSFYDKKEGFQRLRKFWKDYPEGLIVFG